MAETLFRYPVDIQFRHCDPAGIVYYPRFIDMAEGAIEEWMLTVLGESYREWIFNRRLGLPRVKVSCEFLRTCSMGERVELLLRLVKFGRSSFELLVEGEVAGETRFKITLVLVSISLETMRPVPFSDKLRANFERYRALAAPPPVSKAASATRTSSAIRTSGAIRRG
jgi:4-hydroxybenzoyl-CoA thioesterase